MGPRGCSRPSRDHHGQVTKSVGPSLRYLSSLSNQACVGVASSLLSFLTQRVNVPTPSIPLPQLPMIRRYLCSCASPYKASHRGPYCSS